MSAAAAELTYRYPFASNLDQAAGKPRLSLATTVENADIPHFFEGSLVAPRAFGDLMLVLSNIRAGRGKSYREASGTLL